MKFINNNHFMFENLTKNFTKYVHKNDGQTLANLYLKYGYYHDYIYGKFKGRKNISTMLSNIFTDMVKSFCGKFKVMRWEIS